MNIIQMHNSWLALNSIVGCTNNCSYCFLDTSSKTPQYLASPQETIRKLLNDTFYHPQIPLCLFPNTDIFLNKRTQNYLLEILDLIEKNHITNDLILITKCLIPQKILTRLKELIENGQNVIVYLSYSGLDKSLEPNIHPEHILKNFEQLKKYNIPTIHYFRPLLPQNSNSEKMAEILNTVNKYTNISVVNGLMVNPTKEYSYWEEITEINSKDPSKISTVWPQEAWNYLLNEYQGPQLIYQTNLCALNAALKRPCPQFYQTPECQIYNHCSLNQRKKCQSEIQNNETITQEITKILISLNIKENYQVVPHPNGQIELIGPPLNISVIAYIAQRIKRNVYMPNGIGLNEQYNSNFNGAKPYILKRGPQK